MSVFLKTGVVILVKIPNSKTPRYAPTEEGRLAIIRSWKRIEVATKLFCIPYFMFAIFFIVMFSLTTPDDVFSAFAKVNSIGMLLLLFIQPSAFALVAVLLLMTCGNTIARRFPAFVDFSHLERSDPNTARDLVNVEEPPLVPDFLSASGDSDIKAEHAPSESAGTVDWKSFQGSCFEEGDGSAPDWPAAMFVL